MQVAMFRSLCLYMVTLAIAGCAAEQPPVKTRGTFELHGDRTIYKQISFALRDGEERWATIAVSATGRLPITDEGMKVHPRLVEWTYEYSVLDSDSGEFELVEHRNQWTQGRLPDGQHCSSAWTVALAGRQVDMSVSVDLLPRDSVAEARLSLAEDVEIGGSGSATVEGDDRYVARFDLRDLTDSHETVDVPVRSVLEFFDAHPPQIRLGQAN